MTLLQFIFYVFSALMLLSAVGTIISRNPVHGALFLVVCFVASAGIWLMLQAEFLGLVLVLVYVGAVMTLFLFVVMMLNLDKLPSRAGFKKYWPFGILILLLLVGLMIYVVAPSHLSLASNAIAIPHPADYSNVQALGAVIYTQYVYAFEIAAVILLVAIIAAISLAFHAFHQDTKRQNISKQVQTTAAERLRLVKNMGKE
ncbi:MAG: NADH-quinone oxidoreductase subunit J [Gammaproteobacteria bacterium]|nr:NADH-quinone oxidoreductase subunit J [Gammaproteobacteria bacterium]